jgi:single-strand DNA-binding protein
MNIWTGIVRVVADAEQRYSQSGSAVCTVRLVADSGYGDKKKPLWMRGVLFGKRAEGGLAQLLTKGQQLSVCGELSMNEWENKDGQKQQSLELTMEKVTLVGGKNEYRPQHSTGDDVPMDDGSVPF